MNRPNCVLLTTSSEHIASPAEQFARHCFDVRLVSKHSWENARINDDILAALDSRDVEYLFSFLCPVIIPDYMLQMVRTACINIHPAPPEYPGVGSSSRALYDQQSQYGVTAHLMDGAWTDLTGDISALRTNVIFGVETNPPPEVFFYRINEVP